MPRGEGAKSSVLFLEKLVFKSESLKFSERGTEKNENDDTVS